MSTFVRCIGCGEPLYGSPCQWCTCERCGNDLRDGYCFLCNSRNENSFTYDSNPNSFNNPSDFSYPPPQPQYQTYSCELCGNGAHYSYDCPPQVLFVYNQDPCFNQNFDNDFPQTSPNFPQQFPCCENYGGLHETLQCQPINQNFYEPNLFYNSISSGFDQFQPPQFPVIHQPLQEMSIQDMEDLKQHYLDEMLSLSNDLQIKDYHNEKIDIRFRRECEDMTDELKSKLNRMSIEINKKKELQRLEHVANLSTYPLQCFKSFCYDDDDEESSIPLRDIISKLPPSIAITPVLPTLEPEDSLIMGDEHLSTILEKESDEFINYSVEDLVPIPSELEDTSGSERVCDLPSCDDFSPINVYKGKSVTFSNPSIRFK
ncbi:hypothetical protein Tco_1275480 [Tanacetum coccineum]